MGKMVFSEYYFYFENKNTISIFKIHLETISIFYFQNSFKNYFVNLKIVPK